MTGGVAALQRLQLSLSVSGIRGRPRVKAPAQCICIGREGNFRLCEHREITWADIEACVGRSLAEKSYRADWTNGEDMVILYQHPGHEPCRSKPRSCTSMSSLKYRYDPWVEVMPEPWGSVLLGLHWQPYKELYQPGGRFEAWQVRSMLEEHRQPGVWPAELISPSAAWRCFTHAD